MEMRIRHKGSGKTIRIQLTDNMADYRARVYLAADLATRAMHFANGQAITAHYNPHYDKWFTSGGNTKVRLEADTSLAMMADHGFEYTEGETGELKGLKNEY